MLVAGANYGRAYLSALAHAPERFLSAGLLATGSARSIRAAAEFEVPLYRSLDELPEGIDLVCAAVGTGGFPVVLDLLRAGVPVLCEHPLTPALLDSAIQEARTHALLFHVNGHFSMLPASREFSRRVAQLAEPPAFVDVMATDRSLYAVLDILFQSLNGPGTLEIESVQAGQPFALVKSAFNGIAVLFRLQFPRVNAIPDGNAAYLVDYQITAGFRSGILTLLSMGGPVIWTANYAYVQTKSFEGTQQAGSDELRAQRRDANLEAIERILSRTTPPEQQPGHLHAVSAAWQQVGGAMVR